MRTASLLCVLITSCCPCKELRGTLTSTHIAHRQEGLPDSVLCEKLRAAEWKSYTQGAE